MLENAFIIPALMALSFVIILFFGKRVKGGQGAHLIGVPFITAAWVLSLVVGVQWIDRVQDAEAKAEEAFVVGTVEPASSVVVDGDIVLAQTPVLAAEEGEKLKVEPVIQTVEWWSNGGTPAMASQPMMKVADVIGMNLRRAP